MKVYMTVVKTSMNDNKQNKTKRKNKTKQKNTPYHTSADQKKKPTQQASTPTWQPWKHSATVWHAESIYTVDINND